MPRRRRRVPTGGPRARITAGDPGPTHQPQGRRGLRQAADARIAARPPRSGRAATAPGREVPTAAATARRAIAHRAYSKRQCRRTKSPWRSVPRSRSRRLRCATRGRRWRSEKLSSTTRRIGCSSSSRRPRSASRRRRQRGPPIWRRRAAGSSVTGGDSHGRPRAASSACRCPRRRAVGPSARPACCHRGAEWLTYTPTMRGREGRQRLGTDRRTSNRLTRRVSETGADRDG